MESWGSVCLGPIQAVILVENGSHNLVTWNKFDTFTSQTQVHIIEY